MTVRRAVKTLALGSPETAHYRSIRRIMYAFGDVTFRHERSFPDGSDVVRHVHEGGFDQVLLPNPYGNAKRLACYLALRESGFPLVVSERGALPGAWFFDAGFNYDSPSYDPSAWDCPLTVAESAAVQRYRQHLTESAEALEAQGTRRSPEDLKTALGLEGKKVLVVPLQRPADTVVKHFAGPVDGMEGLLGLVQALAQELAAHGDDGWEILLKQHPLEGGQRPPRHRALKYVPDGTHVHDLLSIADAVLVLNSGVGLLSLAFGKPTIAIGEAFYAHRGLARRASSAAEVMALLSPPKPPDDVAVQRFLHHLLKRVYSFGTFHTQVARQRDGSLARVTRRIDFRELRVLGEDIPPPARRVVVVSPFVPWPIYRGSQSRVDVMLRGLLATGSLVSLCALNSSASKPREECVADLRQRYPGLEHIEVHDHPSLRGPLRRLRNRARKSVVRVTGAAHRVANWDTCPRDFRRAVHRLCEDLAPEYLLVNYAKLAPVVPSHFSGTAVLDTHDYQTRFLEEDQQANGIRTWVDVARFRESEHEALRRFHKIIAINPVEVPPLTEAAPHAEVCCIPAFSEAHEAPPPPTYDYDAVFVASMSNFNVTGLRWFVDHVLPEVLERRPAFRMAIIGNIARAKAIAPLRAHPALDFGGVAPGLGTLYARSRVVVAPLLGGAGMKIKVIEALAHGKALVCTTKAAEGIAITPGRHAWIADDAEGFARGILELCEQPTLRAEMERHARELHARCHSPEIAQRALQAVLGIETGGIPSRAGDEMVSSSPSPPHAPPAVHLQEPSCSPLAHLQHHRRVQ